MKLIVNLNIITTNILVIARSPIGQVLLILLLVTFDAAANSLAISILFVERIREFIAIGSTFGAQDVEQAQQMAIRFSMVASVCLGLGIFITSLLTERIGKVVKSHPASIWLALTSFVLSFVGFVMVIIPQGEYSFWNLMGSPLFVIKLFFVFVLAAFSPYLTAILSHNLAQTYSQTFDLFMDEVIAKTHEKMKDQLLGLTKKKDRRQQDPVKFTVNRIGSM